MIAATIGAALRPRMSKALGPPVTAMRSFVIYADDGHEERIYLKRCSRRDARLARCLAHEVISKFGSNPWDILKLSKVGFSLERDWERFVVLGTYSPMESKITLNWKRLESKPIELLYVLLHELGHHFGIRAGLRDRFAVKRHAWLVTDGYVPATAACKGPVLDDEEAFVDAFADRIMSAWMLANEAASEKGAA